MRSKPPNEVRDALARLAKRLNEKFGPAELYLFGSFAKGDWLEDSDIDIVTVSEKFEGRPMPERINAVRGLAPDDMAFEILAYTPKELKEALKRSITIQDASTYWKKISWKA